MSIVLKTENINIYVICNSCSNIKKYTSNDILSIHECSTCKSENISIDQITYINELPIEDKTSEEVINVDESLDKTNSFAEILKAIKFN